MEETVEHLPDQVELCRTCMNERGSEVVGDQFTSVFSILEEQNVCIADCLTQWVGSTIQPDDGLPSEICTPCLEAITSIMTFIENVKDCDVKLRNLIKPKDVICDSDIENSRVSAEEEDSKSVLNDDIKIENVDNLSIMDDFSDEEITIKLENENSNSEEIDVKIDLKRKRATRKRGKRTKASEESTSSLYDNLDELDEKEIETYNVIDVGEKYVCCGCFSLFDTEQELESHGQEFHQEFKKRNNPVNYNKNIVCKFCYRRFEHNVQCQNHRKQFEILDKLYECKKCNRRFINAKPRRRHAHHHPEWNVEMPMYFSVPMSRLEKHGYLCCVRGCTSSHSSEDELFTHIKNDHILNQKIFKVTTSEKEYQCVFCSRTFESKVKLDYHHLHKYNTVSHQCHECGKIYRSLELLKAHENKHANIKPYECDFCQKRFYSPAVLKAHTETHTQEKNLFCTICGMAFLRKAFLENHYRIHSDLKPFKCDVCHKDFKHSSSLFSHRRIHFPDKQVECSECGKGFTDSANLKRHMVSHTGIKPYQCGHCEKRFMRLGERSEHESLVHLGVMPYKCDECGAEFSSKRRFQRHKHDAV